jgi:hypothetical protein
MTQEEYFVQTLFKHFLLNNLTTEQIEDAHNESKRLTREDTRKEARRVALETLHVAEKAAAKADVRTEEETEHELIRQTGIDDAIEAQQNE